jgi:N-acetyl-anhydromuramyl-L-alanine amidase AmpD
MTMRGTGRWLGIILAMTLTVCASGLRQASSGQGETANRAVESVLQPVIAAEVLSPNTNERPLGAHITCIVLHHTHRYETALATARYFQSPASQVSAHYIVDRDGSLVRCVPDDKRAWHAGVSRFQGVDNVNDYSIGIEIANRGDNVDPYPEAQMQTVIRLVTWLCRQYGIAPERITRHRDVALPAGRKDDPSDSFDFARVLRAVEVGQQKVH